MKFKIINIIILSSIFIACSDGNRILDYNEYLKVELPKNMIELEVKKNSNIHDYNNLIIYRLTSLERNSLIEQLYYKECDSIKKDCWRNYGDVYSYEISDSTLMSGYYIRAVLLGDEINTLTVYESKWK